MGKQSFLKSYYGKKVNSMVWTYENWDGGKCIKKKKKGGSEELAPSKKRIICLLHLTEI